MKLYANGTEVNSTMKRHEVCNVLSPVIDGAANYDGIVVLSNGTSQIAKYEVFHPADVTFMINDIWGRLTGESK